MNRDDAEEYTQALGQVVGGGWRQVALGVRLEVPQSLGLTTRQWVDRLGGYVRLSIDERREAVVELVAEGMTTRQVGEVLGVDHVTVLNDRRAVAGENSPPPADEEAAGQADESPSGENSPEVADGEPPERGDAAAPEENSPPEPSRAVSDFVEADPNLQDIRYRRAFLKSLAQVSSFLQFDAERLGVICESAEAEQLEQWALSYQEFVRKFSASRGRLRVLNGSGG